MAQGSLDDILRHINGIIAESNHLKDLIKKHLAK